MDDLLVYTLLSRGYKGQALDNSSNSVFYRAPFEKNNQPVTPEDALLNPETIINWELGFKQRFAHKGFLRANVFVSEVTDLQLASYDGNTTSFRFINAGSVRSQGVEMALQWMLVDGLLLHLAGSYIDAYYLSFTGAPCQVSQQMAGTCSAQMGGQDLSGKKVNETPPWQWVAQVDYTYALSAGEIHAQIDFQYQDSFIFDVDQDKQTEQSAFGLVHLALDFMHYQGVGMGIFINNLFDEYHAERIIDAPIFQGAYQLYPGEGRRVGLSFQYDY
ncbi:MAG: TonB-dependent receptor [Cellvibrionales bacterium]|nr:TonB-dependent receptor [Cellvibrionales bacterium]